LMEAPTTTVLQVQAPRTMVLEVEVVLEVQALRTMVLEDRRCRRLC